MSKTLIAVIISIFAVGAVTTAVVVAASSKNASKTNQSSAEYNIDSEHEKIVIDNENNNDKQNSESSISQMTTNPSNNGLNDNALDPNNLSKGSSSASEGVVNIEAETEVLDPLNDDSTVSEKVYINSGIGNSESDVIYSDGGSSISPNNVGDSNQGVNWEEKKNNISYSEFISGDLSVQESIIDTFDSPKEYESWLNDKKSKESKITEKSVDSKSTGIEF